MRPIDFEFIPSEKDVLSYITKEIQERASKRGYSTETGVSEKDVPYVEFHGDYAGHGALDFFVRLVFNKPEGMEITVFTRYERYLATYVVKSWNARIPVAKMVTELLKWGKNSLETITAKERREKREEKEAEKEQQLRGSLHKYYVYRNSYFWDGEDW
jgi:hypothetical protein